MTTMATDAPAAGTFEQFRGFTGKPLVSAPLDVDTVRRFVQAVMDDDPAYHDGDSSRHGAILAPPLYPVHAIRPAPGAPDPLDSVAKDPDADGTGDLVSTLYGLPPIHGAFKRLLNGGNEIEFHRCLHVGERAVATPRYRSIELKHGRSGDILLVVIETCFTTETGELLLVNRQTAIWR
jgi:N-terminal half of MaoC dehydratase